MNWSDVRVHAPAQALWLALLAVGCDDGAGGGPGTSGGRPHLVADTAPTYDEASEAGNAGTAGSEPTGYTLDADGLVIRGAFEPGTPTQDCFRFSTGTATDVDVQLFVDGVGLDGSPGAAFLSLDAVLDDGYSSLTGYDYFASAWVAPGQMFRVCLTPNAAVAGEAYEVELRASPN